MTTPLLPEGRPSARLDRFRCTGCGDCCRGHRAPLTAADVARLAVATGLPLAELVELVPATEVDVEPESLVELPGGRALPVLPQPGGACRFLGAGERCGVYPARPAACRTFPLEVAETPSPGGRFHLEVLEGARCPGVLDGPPAGEAHRAALRDRDAELTRNLRLVEVWNRRQRRRRLAGRRLAGAAELLAFLAARGAGGGEGAPGQRSARGMAPAGRPR